MKLSHLSIALLWAFMVTVEAQSIGTIYPDNYAGYQTEKWANDTSYLRVPEAPKYSRYPQETVNIYQHPDQGALPQVPYITVPVQSGTGDTYRRY